MSKLCYFTGNNYEYYCENLGGIYFNSATITNRLTSSNIEDISYTFKFEICTKSDVPPISLGEGNIEFRVIDTHDTDDGYKEFVLSFDLPIINLNIWPLHNGENIFTSIIIYDLSGNLLRSIFSLNISNTFECCDLDKNEDFNKKFNCDMSAIYLYKKLKEYSKNSNVEIIIKP